MVGRAPATKKASPKKAAAPIGKKAAVSVAKAVPALDVMEQLLVNLPLANLKAMPNREWSEAQLPNPTSLKCDA